MTDLKLSHAPRFYYSGKAKAGQVHVSRLNLQGPVNILILKNGL